MEGEEIKDKFHYIGMLILNLSKAHWKQLNSYYENKSLNNANAEQKQQESHKTMLFCKIQTISDFIWNVRTEYKLSAYQIKCRNMDQYPDIMQAQSSLKNENLIMNAKIKHKDGILNDLMNLEEKNICKFFNPIAMQEANQKLIIVNAQNQQETYYFDNIEQGQFFTIGLQVLVSQIFLKQMTQNYESLFENNEEQKIQQQLIYINRLNQIIDYSGNQKEISCLKTEKSLLNVIINLIDRNQAKKGLKSIEKAFQDRNYKLNKLLNMNNYKYDEYNSKKVQPFISNANQINIDQNNPTLSFNFAGQKNEVGLFFDLDQNRTPQCPKPNGFVGELKPYQARALTWMLFRQGERGGREDIGMDVNHIPYWWNAGLDLGIKQNLFINTQLKMLVWRRKIEKKCNGGLLADEMGLGKTIMIIALILAHKKNQSNKTLIIAPLSVIKQWQQQIKKFAPELKVHVINQQKLSDIKYENSNVVITTEGKVRSQLKLAAEESTIKKRNWFRIVIDEAHNFKNSKTAMAKTVYELNAEYRWCLTGTPTQNSIADLFSLIKFLRFMPWCLQARWYALFPIDIKRTTTWHFLKMKQLLKGILLRRKKQSVDSNGYQLINIPKVDVKVHIVKMSEQARIIYQYVDIMAQNALNSLEKLQQIIKNTRDVERRKMLNISKRNKYQQILGLMVRMRMICCHQFMSKYKSGFVSFQNFQKQYIKFLAKNKVKRLPKYNFFQFKLSTEAQRQQLHKYTKHLNKAYQNWDQKIFEISTGRQYLCLKCKNDVDLFVTPCVHVFCKYCIGQHLSKSCAQHNESNRQYFQRIGKSEKYKIEKLRDYKGECPQCFQQLKQKQLFEMPKINEFGRSLQQLQLNQKILALLEYLKKMQQCQKAIIFTSFIGMLILVSYALEKERISFVTVQGNDNYEQRHAKISQFNKSNGVRVLIITLKTGAVGLNMEAANKVFFMDPWWNPAIEDQAIARVHRIGQQKQVEAVKFITQSTIQAKILKLSIHKKEMSDSILDIDDVLNDTRYSKSRSEIKFLLSMQETLNKSQKQQQQQQQREQQQMKLNHIWEGIEDPFYYNYDEILQKRQKQEPSQQYRQNQSQQHPFLQQEQQQSQLRQLKQQNGEIEQEKKA